MLEKEERVNRYVNECWDSAIAYVVSKAKSLRGKNNLLVY